MIVRLLQTYCGLPRHSKALLINKAPILFPKNVCNMTRYTKSLYKVNSQNIHCRRKFYSFKKPTAEDLRLSDNIPPPFVLIYNNRMKNYLVFGHLTICVCIATFTIFLLINNGSIQSESKNEGGNSTRLRNDQLIFIIALITFIAVLQSLIMRMPIRIYNNPKTNDYAFIYYGLIPSYKKSLYCRLTEIVKQEERGLLPWKNSRFIIKETESAILIDNFFRTPSDFNIILRYEKPPTDG